MKENVLIEPNQAALPPPASSPHASDNGQALARAGREKQQMDRARITTLVFALVGASLLIPVALDYHYFWPTTVRCLISATWWLLVILGGGVVVGAWRRQPRMQAVALDLERRLSTPRCEVSTAAQYAGKAAREPKGIDDELVDALQRRAAIHLEKAVSPYHAPLLVWGGLLALGLIAVALALTLAPSYRIAAQRSMFPWTPVPYTTVEVRPGAVEIATKSDVDVTVQFSGRLPAHARVEWEEAGGAWKTDQLAQTGPDSFSYKFKDVRGDFTYRIRGNDALTVDYPVRVYTPPEIASMDVEIVPPPYAQMASTHSTVGHVTALRGSELRWRLSSILPLAQAEFHFKEGAPHLSLNAGNPQTWLGSMILKKDTVYQVALLDLKGHANRPGDEFRLVALPDAPPEVEILSPEQNITAGPKDKIRISIQADDDVGLAEVRLVSQKPGSPSQSIILGSGDKPGRHVKGDVTLDLAPLNLQPYDVVMFYAEARDNNTYDGPGITRSSVHFVTIANPAQAPQMGDNGGSGGQAQEVNLLQLQRDLISATARLSESASGETQADLASSQQEIKGYAEKFLAVMQIMGAPPAAASAMDAAIKNMSQAGKELNAGESVPALDQEGQALANMYQVARLLPDMLPSKGGSPGEPALKIVLEDLRKAKQEKQLQAHQEISAALAKAQALLKTQQALQQHGKSGEGKNQGENPNQSPGESPTAGKDDKDDKNGKDGGLPKDQPGDSAQSNPDLAAKQQALADQARELAEHLSQAAGHNPGLSHHLGADVGLAADQMGVAADKLQHGAQPDSPEVTDAQFQGVRTMTRVIQALAQLSGDTTDKSNVEEEGAPPEYSELLSRYYQKLSHEK